MNNNIDNLNDNVNLNLNLNRNVNGTYKQTSNEKLKQDKLNAISELKGCNYRTPPKEIASYLEIIFTDKKTKEGHWLYLSQHYPPRRINQVISKMIKEGKRGDETISNPAKYFTFLIKFRKERKRFRDTNDTCKQQKQ